MFYEQKRYSEMSENLDDDLSEVEMRLMARRPSIEGNQFVYAPSEWIHFTPCSLFEQRALTAEKFPIGSRGRLQTELLQRVPSASVGIGETDGETCSTCFRRPSL